MIRKLGSQQIPSDARPKVSVEISPLEQKILPMKSHQHGGFAGQSGGKTRSGLTVVGAKVA